MAVHTLANLSPQVAVQRLQALLTWLDAPANGGHSWVVLHGTSLAPQVETQATLPPNHRYSVWMAEPVAEHSWCAHTLGQMSCEDVLAQLDALDATPHPPAMAADDPSGMLGSWSLYLAYEFGYWLDPVFQSERSQVLDTAPDTLLFKAQRYNTYWVWDWQANTVTIAQETPSPLGLALWDTLKLSVFQPPPTAPTLTTPPISSLNAEGFETQVNTLLKAIQDGDLYQANLSLRWTQDRPPGNAPVQLWQQLLEANPSPFSALWRHRHQDVDHWLLCNSPERLVRWDASGLLSSRPIAGTRGRGPTPEDDARRAQELLTSLKEQAEHQMLTDLIRNDLGRLCHPGTVVTPELMTLERYQHVTHLVSEVQGQSRPDVTLGQVIQAMFPGGTITGAPKIRAMQYLAACEPVLRQFYTGSFGVWRPQPRFLDLNILIRSAWLTPTHVHYHGGAGIVADSVAPHEWKECHRKVRSLQQRLAGG